ncbi:hypothetical protein [Vibrio sp. B1Z05]|uniref:hypothetical protein n=1 Tax=Vibrio sp. B1Z05 TaxID=2654980 RepID=UPI00128E24C5|nr:hypothetical protein [Vibrio sp. B1Z05]MPW37403.1 hypothetical protein [Vibrio sp. B1Z05]
MSENRISNGYYIINNLEYMTIYTFKVMRLKGEVENTTQKNFTDACLIPQLRENDNHYCFAEPKTRFLDPESGKPKPIRLYPISLLESNIKEENNI